LSAVEISYMKFYSALSSRRDKGIINLNKYRVICSPMRQAEVIPHLLSDKKTLTLWRCNSIILSVRVVQCWPYLSYTVLYC